MGDDVVASRRAAVLVEAGVLGFFSFGRVVAFGLSTPLIAPWHSGPDDEKLPKN